MLHFYAVQDSMELFLGVNEPERSLKKQNKRVADQYFVALRSFHTIMVRCRSETLAPKAVRSISVSMETHPPLRSKLKSNKVLICARSDLDRASGHNDIV